MCSLSHSPMFPNNSAVRIISRMWWPCHLRCDCTWRSLLHHLHRQALELKAPPLPSSISIVAGARNCYYHGTFSGPHSQDLKNNLIIQKNICEKNMERNNWMTMLKKKIWWLRSSWWDDTMCWMMNHSSWRKKKTKYHPKKWWLYVCVNSLARARLPLEKVVAMAQLCEYGHWWYLALWWCWWYRTFYKRLIQC
jgi:hypothetical protein